MQKNVHNPYENSYFQSDYNFKKVSKIRNYCIQQSQQFQKWSKKGMYSSFHSSHYDWWAFPINQYSQKGDQFKVDQYIIQYLKKDNQFIRALKNNAIYVCQAWGWNLEKRCEIVNKKPSQRWQGWPIRLYKMSKSLEIFGCIKEHQSTKLYANFLFKKGERMKSYKGRDFEEYFMQKVKKQQQFKSKRGVSMGPKAPSYQPNKSKGILNYGNKMIKKIQTWNIY